MTFLTSLFKTNALIQHAQDVVLSTYGDTVSVSDKKKDLLKFGSHTSVGTGWETVMQLQDSETEETFVSGNDITHIISTDVGDTDDVTVEGHSISGGETTFVSQTVTLNGQTAVALTTPLFRANRCFNVGASALAGAVACYEGGAVTSGKPDDDAQVHLLIVAGDQQTEKAQTTISSSDYWIITNVTGSVLAKTAKYAEFRLEAKPVGSPYWSPLTQIFAVNDQNGTIELLKEPYIICPKNHDVRLSVRTNTSGVDVAGGFNGFLASVL